MEDRKEWKTGEKSDIEIRNLSVTFKDGRIRYDVYSLEMVVAIAFRLRTKECMVFRRFIMDRLYTNNCKKPVHLFFSLSNAHPRCMC